MVQRVVRQIQDSQLDAEITIAIGEGQRDAISCQLGNTVGLVTEPERRDTFPAIALACLYLEKGKRCALDETVVVNTDENYFRVIGQMADAVEHSVADLVLMGIEPTYASTKYGYIVPQSSNGIIRKVECFTEKTYEERAKELIDSGALWNGAYSLSNWDI